MKTTREAIAPDMLATGAIIVGLLGVCYGVFNLPLDVVFGGATAGLGAGLALGGLSRGRLRENLALAKLMAIAGGLVIFVSVVILILFKL